MNMWVTIALAILLVILTVPVGAQTNTLSDADILDRRLPNLLEHGSGLTLSITYLPSENESNPRLPSLIVDGNKFIPVKDPDSHRLETGHAQMKQIAQGLNKHGWLKQAICTRFPLGHLPMDMDAQRPAYVISLRNAGWCYQQTLACNAQVYRQIQLLQNICPPAVSQALAGHLLIPLSQRFPQWEVDANRVWLSTMPNPKPRDPIEYRTDHWNPQRFWQALYGLDGKLEIIKADIVNLGVIDGDIQYQFTTKPKADGYYTFIFVLISQPVTRQIRFVTIRAHQNNKVTTKAVRITPQTANSPNPVTLVKTDFPFDIGWRFYPGGEGRVGGWHLAAIHYADMTPPDMKTCLELLLRDNQ